MSDKIDDIISGKKNPGLIKISKDISKDFVAMAIIFQEFELWEFKYDPYSETYVMLVKSEHFDSLDLHEAIPFYEFEIAYSNGDFFIKSVTRHK